MLARPNFMPKRSRLKRNSSGDGLTVATGTRSRLPSPASADGRRRPATRALRRRELEEHAPIVVLELAPIDDHVQHAVLEEELAALEALGQLLPDGLLDDARAGEADQRLRLGDVHVAQHGEARGHAAGRGIGQHARCTAAARDRAARAPR